RGLHRSVLVGGFAAAHGLDEIGEVIATRFARWTRLTLLPEEGRIIVVPLHDHVTFFAIEDVSDIHVVFAIRHPRPYLELDHLFLIRIEISRAKCLGSLFVVFPKELTTHSNNLSRKS